MRILVACEESQAVTTEMRRFGHEAYTCLITNEQMRRLIQLVVSDCKVQGIETMTPDELAALMGRWNAQKNTGVAAKQAG